MKEKIVLGLSDGVDSAVAALVLQAQGYEVLGVYLKNAGESELGSAQTNARETGIGFYALEIKDNLQKRVCEPFIDEYLCGRTPSPCPGCNRTVKLETLMRFADEHGVQKIATGHYVLKKDGLLYMGEAECDQSYMLCLLTKEQVSRLELPLGDKSKSEVRQMAAKAGLSCAFRPDSRENCFIREMDYASYIRRARPDQLRGEGEVIYKGSVFDTHEGIYAYTVGQRWKRDCEGRRLYVSRIDAERNTIELCLWEELFTNVVDIDRVSLLYGAPEEETFSARIRVRHTRWETPQCTLQLRGESACAHTASPLRAPAPGQIAALYVENRLIGGGTVASTAADHPMKR